MPKWMKKSRGMLGAITKGSKRRRASQMIHQTREDGQGNQLVAVGLNCDYCNRRLVYDPSVRMLVCKHCKGGLST